LCSCPLRRNSTTRCKAQHRYVDAELIRKTRSVWRHTRRDRRTLPGGEARRRPRLVRAPARTCATSAPARRSAPRRKRGRAAPSGAGAGAPSWSAIAPATVPSTTRRGTRISAGISRKARHGATRTPGPNLKFPVVRTGDTAESDSLHWTMGTKRATDNSTAAGRLAAGPPSCRRRPRAAVRRRPGHASANRSRSRGVVLGQGRAVAAVAAAAARRS
jgi:hypothetical protein